MARGVSRPVAGTSVTMRRSAPLAGGLLMMCIFAMPSGCSKDGEVTDPTVTASVDTVGPAATAPWTSLYVAPNGSGAACTSASPCSLEQAVSLLPQFTPAQKGDIFVYLGGGTYTLTAPLALGPAQSGGNGFMVRFVAAPGATPVISGGQVISGWTPVDGGAGVYEASVPAGFDTRQLYVNGVRANRARRWLNRSPGLGSSSAYPNAAAPTGYRIMVPDLASLPDVQNIEIVSRVAWKEFRCPVQSASVGHENLISFSRNGGFAPPATGLLDQGMGAHYHVGDFTGDGRSDILFKWVDGSGTWHNGVAASNGSAFANAVEWLTGIGGGAAYSVGDFDGDRKSDVLMAYGDSGTWHNVVALSTGASFSGPVDWLTNAGQGSKYFVGDYNGDGKSDVLMAYGASGTWHNAVALSTGSSLAGPVDWLTNAGQGTQYYAGDFDGDGKSDVLMAYSDGGTWRNVVARSTGSSFSGPVDWLTNAGQGASYYVGDYNGDGKSDVLMTYFDASSNWHNAVALSTGSSFSGPVDWLTNVGQGTSYHPGDFDGDGKSDVLYAFSDSILVPRDPCWTNGNKTDAAMKSGLSWLENSRSFLAAPGDWYLDKAAGKVSYMPRSGEDLSTAVVVASRLEQLVAGAGAGANSHVQNIAFSGIVFAYSTWLEPSTSSGFVELQSGVHFGAAGTAVRTPAALSFSSARNIVFSQDQFVHIGSYALNFDGGSKKVWVVGNTFADLSSGAIELGGIDDRNPSDPDAQDDTFDISNNYIANTGVEYEGSAAVFGGYVRNAVLANNEIHDVPYTGISMGWGWRADETISGGAATFASGNQMNRNFIHGVMQVLFDGGGIYTLGPQKGSSLTGNVIQGVGPAGCAVPSAPAFLGYVGIYHDNGTMHYTDTQNVVSSSCGYWLLLQANWPKPQNDTYDTKLTSSFVDVDSVWCGGGVTTSASPACSSGGNSVTGVTVFGSAPPAAVQTIMNAAGVQSAYAYTKNVVGGALY